VLRRVFMATAQFFDFVVVVVVVVRLDWRKRLQTTLVYNASLMQL
jgi:hypothetical protein